MVLIKLMMKNQKLPIKPDKVNTIANKGNKTLLKSFYTQNNQANLTGQENYFSDLATGLYRTKLGIRDTARAWKFIFKHFFFAKELFSKIDRASKKKFFVLDIGCGKGYFRKVLENNIREREKVIYFGVDLRKDILKRAIFDTSIDSGAQGDKVTSIYIWHDATKEFPLKSNSFDFIISSQLIKYLEKDKVNYLISEIHRLLKKDGILLLSNGLMFNEKVDLNIAAKRKNRVEYYWTTKELMKIFRKNKFKKIDIYGGEATLKILMGNIKSSDRVLINKFRKIFPDEIVESIFGFFYPKLSGVKIFLAKK